MTEPTTNKDKSFIFRCTEAMRDEAKAKATTQGISLSKVICTILQWYIDGELEVYADRALNASQHGES